MTYEMDHVAPFLRFATSATLTMTTMPDMALAPGPSYDYVAEADAVIANMATVDTAGELDEIRFFDGKLNVALGLIGTLLLGYGQSIEEIMLHSFGETSAVHDAGVAVWKNKLLNSRIRPTTVIHELYPDDSLRLNDNMTVRGKHFQTIVRTMSHSEYPSGSAAVCAAIRDFVDALWPHLTLTMQGDEVSYSDAPFVILPNTAMATVPLTGAVNPAPGGLSAAAIAERCGATRELGGMHFSQSVPAGRKLAAGMGAEAAATLLSLLGPREGSVRQALGGSAPCAADCCAAAVECNATAQAICKARCAGRWDTPWFDVVLARVGALGAPSREAATEAPFFQADRNHIMIIGAMAGLVPAITDGYAFSFQTRFTNLVDQLVWNAFASNSERLQALLFGDATHRGVEPLVRSGHTSTDAKVVTAIHAIAAALPFFLPEAAGAFCAAPAPCFLLRPTIGLEPGLIRKGQPLGGFPGGPRGDFAPGGRKGAFFPPKKEERTRRARAGSGRSSRSSCCGTGCATGGTQWASTAGARAGPRTACRTQRDARSTTRRLGTASRRSYRPRGYENRAGVCAFHMRRRVHGGVPPEHRSRALSAVRRGTPAVQPAGWGLPRGGATGLAVMKTGRECAFHMRRRVHGGVPPEHRSRALSYENACTGHAPGAHFRCREGGRAREPGVRSRTGAAFP
ncbi:hypothetical protein EMIHUDRAFT_444965 [Emiliania huxleyi CCMP1516]|uniref:Uncharacterized protein n=2 Tax=Emiliania huxleyi TaxID=2903 RepID=A0A0D3J6U5_EMIH1|nr:hypothetical protein EMIHUDRAFT_444965 [Emiliania huxleyi CCMP1516]EOD19230.1 hypothetical protein EMIHUDRAFT_444965 [Emiliania huxleyi CCMP1516]|eukprot:XP_005771659.1 hypothetical protein EMIHUDRAFT_444965 [Emiliania huxleyi CCMP1516]